MNLQEKVTYETKWTIEKYDATGQKYAEEVVYGNALLNSGINAIWTLVCGGTENAFNATNAQLGVGDSTAAVAPTQTDLQGTNQFWKAMDSGYPQFGVDQKVIFRSTFGPTDANFAWNEFGVRNGSGATRKVLNRRVESKGTKTAGEVWVLTLELRLQ